MTVPKLILGPWLIFLVKLVASGVTTGCAVHLTFHEHLGRKRLIFTAWLIVAFLIGATADLITQARDKQEAAEHQAVVTAQQRANKDLAEGLEAATRMLDRTLAKSDSAAVRLAQLVESEQTEALEETRLHRQIRSAHIVRGVVATGTPQGPGMIALNQSGSPTTAPGDSSGGRATIPRSFRALVRLWRPLTSHRCFALPSREADVELTLELDSTKVQRVGEWESLLKLGRTNVTLRTSRPIGSRELRGGVLRDICA
jgi:hypothetical protein